jgi:hypothetical protein
MSPKPARGGATEVPGKAGHEGFWSSFLHGAEHLGEDALNATASLGNAMVHDPGGVFSVLGGLGLVTISSGGEVLGVGLDATGVGAVAGVPLNVLSAAGTAFLRTGHVRSPGAVEVKCSAIQPIPVGRSALCRDTLKAHGPIRSRQVRTPLSRKMA